MPRRWRLLLDGPAAGAWNMGVDEALLASAAAGGLPTLRLYTWRGPWLSLGYGQHGSEKRLAACAQAAESNDGIWLLLDQTAPSPEVILSWSSG